ncbi:1-deoxy-D-xylulose-5-phosphate synthase, partial [bacterium]|nr:1-deoxy-D-xylulose-5-phosphate synthase [bacterium]
MRHGPGNKLLRLMKNNNGNLLNSLNLPDDLKCLSNAQMKILAEEVRGFILDVVSSNGGHLAASLGVVELTLGLLSVMDLPHDRIVWDVGHQSYAHKILTDRRDAFPSLRKSGGISGFPKPSESLYDAFATGHASTAISAALGIARGRDLSGEHYKVAAVVGDGSMGGGMAWEAIND